MIYSFTPFSVEKNFGKAINQCCSIVPNDEDWICIRDGDAMNLTPDWGNIIQDAIDKYGSDYQLFGCLTNRLNKDNGGHQIVSKSCYDDFDMMYHYYLAKSFTDLANNTICPVHSIAGFFMLFQKKTWILAGGFTENSKAFDVKFCNDLKKKGGKIGLINTLYMFHLYRIWAKGDAGRDSKHLNP